MVMSIHKIYVIFYIDDMIITGSDASKMNEFIKLMHARFFLKDMGVLHYFLGIKMSFLINIYCSNSKST